jgi:hypothetical protein
MESDLGSITFSGSTFSMTGLGSEFCSGNYSVSGDTITCTVTRVTAFGEALGVSVGETNYFTIIDDSTLYDNYEDEYYYK